MVPLATGVANCLGEEWSEVLDTAADNLNDYSMIFMNMVMIVIRREI